MHAPLPAVKLAFPAQFTCRMPTPYVGDFHELRHFGMSPMGTCGMGRCFYRCSFCAITVSLFAISSASGPWHFNDDDLSFFDQPKRAATPRGSEAARSSRTANAALAPLVVSPRNIGASVMFVILPNNIPDFSELIFHRAGHPGL
jgi:hypothetical protein